MQMKSFNPPVRSLMGAGSSDVHPRVLEALSRPTIGHLDPAFTNLMDGLKELPQYVFQTKNAMTMPISASGSAGIETCFVDFVEPGDKVVVCQNGALAGKVWNIELMGHSSRAENILLNIGALESVLDDMGADIKQGVVLPAMQKCLD